MQSGTDTSSYKTLSSSVVELSPFNSHDLPTINLTPVSGWTRTGIQPRGTRGEAGGKSLRALLQVALSPCPRAPRGSFVQPITRINLSTERLWPNGARSAVVKTSLNSPNYEERRRAAPDIERYENLVLGNGTAGKHLAWAMAKVGHKTAVVERKYLGGACPNGSNRTTKNRLAPFCMNTDPEVVRVGRNESEAKRDGIEYRLAKMSMTEVLRTTIVSEPRGS